MGLYDYFERIYVVNLPARSDRRQEMVRELGKIGWPVRGGKLEFFDACRFEERGEFPTLGARGCFMSHLSILREARSLGLKNVLVLEDDLMFTGALLAGEQKLVEELERVEWGMVHLGYRIPERDTTSETLELAERMKGGSEKGVELREVRPVEEVLTTAFYGVNGMVFDRAIGCLEGILSRPGGHVEGGPMHVDGAFNTFRRQNEDVRAYVSVPSLSEERPSRSDVTPGKLDQVGLLRPVARLARWVKRLRSDGRLSVA
ncbi:MAG TPA: glycosyltransferase family 25 protein [Tepidisphaeraceae bacterium]|jgi:hypothetical protein|nr:glycosyltransferase family 25 protein [Tepidisphaeraceae bacterium]